MKKIKAPLRLGDGKSAHNMEDLRYNFNLPEVLARYADGKLFTWLEDRYYSTELQAVQALDVNAADFGARLCEVFGVEFPAEVEISVKAVMARNERLERLKQFTDDAAILRSIDSVAFSQEELNRLSDTNIEIIYLCNNVFKIQLNQPNKRYIGLGAVAATTELCTLEDLQQNKIQFEQMAVTVGDVPLNELMPKWDHTIEIVEVTTDLVRKELYSVHEDEITRRLTITSNDRDHLYTWCRYGQRVFYSLCNEGVKYICACDLDGANQTQILADAFAERMVAQRNQVVFYGKGNQDTGIYTVPFDAGQSQKLLYSQTMLEKSIPDFKDIKMMALNSDILFVEVSLKSNRNDLYRMDIKKNTIELVKNDIMHLTQANDRLFAVQRITNEAHEHYECVSLNNYGEVTQVLFNSANVINDIIVRANNLALIRRRLRQSYTSSDNEIIVIDLESFASNSIYNFPLEICYNGKLFGTQKHLYLATQGLHRLSSLNIMRYDGTEKCPIRSLPWNSWDSTVEHS